MAAEGLKLAIPTSLELSNDTDSECGSPIPSTPTITFTVCDDDDDILVQPVNPFFGESVPLDAPQIGSPQGVKRSSVLGIPLADIRRLSDTSMKQVTEKLRQLSSSSGSNSWFSRLSSHKRHRQLSPSCGISSQRKMSVDAGGILKQSPTKNEEPERGFGLLRPISVGLGRKSVSFSTRDNVRIFSVWDDAADGDESEDEPQENVEEEKKDDSESKGRSLVPTFVFPGTRSNYAKDFEKNVLILESVDITEDLCVLGNVRVNMTKLKSLQTVVKDHKSSGRVAVGVTYTTDGWKTSNETRAMVVNATPHPLLKSFDTRAMRFYIDCDELEIGETLEFWLWCSDKFFPVSQSRNARSRNQRTFSRSIDITSKPIIKKYKDDNEGQSYKVSCTPKLNVWAAKAAQELKNLAPVVRYNRPL